MVNLGLVAVALSGFIAAYRQRTRIDKRFTIAVAIVALCISTLTPPRGSSDVYSYAMYGRIVAHYHQSPYTHLPNEYIGDPLLSHVAIGWQHVNSVYGPLFTEISAGLALLAAHSIFLQRFLQQLLEAIVVVTTCVLLQRHRNGYRPWILLALNPATLAIVNGGHNDLLMGGLIALGMFFVVDQKLFLAGLALAAAFLIKATALVAIATALTYIVIFNQRKFISIFIPFATVSLGAYAFGGGFDALRAIFDDSHFTSRATTLSIPHHVLEWLFPNNITNLLVDALALTSFFGLIYIWLIRRRIREVTDATTLTSTASLYASPYVLSWYSGSVLPLAALTESTWASWVALVQSGALLLAYAVPAGRSTGFIIGLVSISALPIGLARTFLSSHPTD